MKYNYAVYLRHNCYTPLFFGLFALILFIGVFVGAYKDNVFSGKKPDLEIIGKYVFALCTSVYLLWVTVVPLARGGLYLLFEDENNTIQVEGTIDKLEKTSPTISYYTKDHQLIGEGEALIVNGEKYYTISYGNKNLGDHVHLTVLPKSHFVLELYIIDSDSSPCDN